jgi:hypothetical protein
MEYVGNLYGRIGNKYFPIGKTAEEVDTEIAKADAQAGRLCVKMKNLKIPFTNGVCVITSVEPN